MGGVGREEDTKKRVVNKRSGYLVDRGMYYGKVFPWSSRHTVRTYIAEASIRTPTP